MDYKTLIIDNLKAMRLIELKNKQPFKARAYDKVIRQVSEMKEDIKTIDDLKSITGVGEGIQKKLASIFEQGYLNAAVSEMPNLEREKHVEELTKIMSIGTVKARELVEKHGITTIEQLREHTDLLNEKQKLGLKYHDHFLKRIPRKEMDRHFEFISKAMPAEFRFEIAGSYRRGLASSGDIDVLVTSIDHRPDEDVKASFQSIITALKTKKYLVDDFGFGAEKYLGVSRLPRFQTYRRIDIMYIPKDKFAFALLYFTGSQGFNIAMRSKALEIGYSLSEHGLKHTKGEHKGDFIDKSFPEEIDIFKFLNMEFVAPTKRV